MDRAIIKVINDKLQNRFFDTEVEEHQVKAELDYPRVEIILTLRPTPTKDFRFVDVEARITPNIYMRIFLIDNLEIEWRAVIKNGVGIWVDLPRGRYQIKVFERKIGF
jgi:hypothetical protein